MFKVLYVEDNNYEIHEVNAYHLSMHTLHKYKDIINTGYEICVILDKMNNNEPQNQLSSILLHKKIYGATVFVKTKNTEYIDIKLDDMPELIDINLMNLMKNVSVSDTHETYFNNMINYHGDYK
mgnify:FL=1|jgi:hypothetical protein